MSLPDPSSKLVILRRQVAWLSPSTLSPAPSAIAIGLPAFSDVCLVASMLQPPCILACTLSMRGYIGHRNVACCHLDRAYPIGLRF